MPYKDPEAKLKWKREWRRKNPELIIAIDKKARLRFKERHPEYRKEYSKRNPDKIRDYYMKNRDKQIEQAKQFHKDHPEKSRSYHHRVNGKEARQEALLTIMTAHNHFGCQYKIHPHMPEALKQRKCWGDLWLEHPNGGGSKDKQSGKLWRKINQSNIPAENYLVLCMLHQIWNMRKAA